MVYRQVLLSRPTESGVAQDVFWIDNSRAKRGARVIDEEGVTWTVEEIYNAREGAELDLEYKAWRTFADKLIDH